MVRHATLVFGLLMSLMLFSACKQKTASSSSTTTSSKEVTKTNDATKKAAGPVLSEDGIQGVLTLGAEISQAPKKANGFARVGDPTTGPNGTKVVSFALEGAKSSQSVFAEYDTQEKLAVLAVEDSAIKTPKGAHAGMPIQEVISLYGTPIKVQRLDLVDAGPQLGFGMCATFAEASTLRFCFAGRGWQARLNHWGKDVVTPNLPVDMIYLVK